MTSKVPVILVAGALGAGKTTLVRRLLSAPEGRRLAVVVNEFAALGIDAELIGDAPGGVLQLENGCICCAGIDALGAALGRLLGHPAGTPDAIVIEASGLADPAPVAARLVYDHRLAPAVELECIVVVEEASTARGSDRDEGEGAARLALADVVILNKTDLADGEELDRQEARIRGVNGYAPLLRTRLCDIGFDQLVRHASSRMPSAGLHAVDAEVRALSLFHDGDLRADLFLAWAAALTREQPGLMRAKGILAFRDRPERFVFQSTASTVDGGYEHPWREAGERSSRLVLIGRNLDEGRLAAGFDDCRA